MEWVLWASLLAAEPIADRAGWFPFVIPSIADEATAGAELDLSFLSPEPAGAGGFLTIRGERFVDGRGREVRLFGTNLCDHHPMPPKELAPAIAARLRQLGFNAVRLHYIDWAAAPAGILAAYPGEALDPTKLDELHYLIAQLRAHGLWIDLNLHVARGYADMPDGWDRMGKGLDRIHEPYLESQKRYAEALLGSRNPYTGRRLADEPAIAIIELNNENTVLGQPPEVWATLPERFSAPLAAAWRTWLRQRYRTTEALRAAWSTRAGSGADLLAAAEAPRLQDAALATLEPTADGWSWHAHRAGGEWHSLQLMWPSVPAAHGTVVTFRGRLRADREVVVSAGLMHQGPPWRGVTPVSKVALAAGRWTEARLAWEVDNPDGAPVRLNLSLENQPARIELAGLELIDGETPGLAADEGLDGEPLRLPADASCRARSADWSAFLADRERSFSAELRRFLRDDIGVRQAIHDTQVNYGGLAGFRREWEVSDQIDIHSYPMHPRRAEEDGRTIWKTGHGSLLRPGFGDLAQWRAAGKPFCVTEFDLNPPNDLNGEALPAFGVLGCLQDWNCLLEYSWFNFQQTDGFDYRVDSQRHPFHTTGNPAQMATIPAVALVFRLGLIDPLANVATLDIPLAATDPAVGAGWDANDRLWHAAGLSPGEPWRTRLSARLTADGPARATGLAATPAGEVVRSAQVVADLRDGQGSLLVDAPSCLMAVGRVCDRELSLGPATLTVASPNTHGHAIVMLVALDGQPLVTSRRALLTTVARAGNQAMRWTDDRAGVVDWGHGPAEMEPVSLRLRLPGGWRAAALEPDGRRGVAVPMPGDVLDTAGGRTPWFLLER